MRKVNCILKLEAGHSLNLRFIAIVLVFTLGRVILFWGQFPLRHSLLVPFQPSPIPLALLGLVGLQQISSKEQLSVQYMISVAPQTRFISSLVKSDTVALFNKSFFFICFFMVYLIGAIIADTAVFSKAIRVRK